MTAGRPRIIGTARGLNAGPTVLAVGSLHGNEPAGAQALERVLQGLDSIRPTLHGEFVAVVGNVTALARGVRFVDHDLNRHFLADRVGALRNGTQPNTRSVEDDELIDLLDTALEVFRAARGPISVLDLHTTSGESPPFVTIGDTLNNRALALQTPAPTILGLEEEIEGTFLEYVNRLGHVTMGFEGGRHDDPRSIEHMEAIVWLTLAATGVLADPAQVPAVQRSRDTLMAARSGLPRVLEVRHRHAVSNGDGFAMRSGYASFQLIRKGDVVADDRAGPIQAPETGRLLLPLYQNQGDDGFFVMREFRTAWLALSAFLRRVRADLLVRSLPGIRLAPDRPDTLVIDRSVARFYALEIFHLLGYRRRRLGEKTLVVSRR